MVLTMDQQGISHDNPAGVIDTRTDPPRIAVLVVGMHRSGTSATTRVLNLLGYTLPAALLGSANDNPRGHWESAAVMHFNDKLLAAAGSSWHDWIPHDAGLADDSFVARGRSLMCKEFGGATRMILKDPRLCRVMPTWLNILSLEAIEPKIVLPIRHPLAVAQSLAHRNGFDEMSGMLLWLRHVLDAENATRGQSRAFLNYEDLLCDWRSVVSRVGDWTGLEWPEMSDPVARKIDEFLTVDLKHHVEADALVSMPSWVRQIYAIVQRWAREGEDSTDHIQIDAIAHGFRNSAENFVPMMSAMADIHSQLQRETAASAAARAQGEALRNERDAAEASLGRMTEDCDLLRTSIANLKNNLASLGAELAAARTRVEEEHAQRTEILSANVILANRYKTQANEMAVLIESHAAHIRHVSAELNQLRTEVTLAQSKAVSCAGKVERQKHIIANLTHKLDKAYSRIDWLSRIGVAIAGFPRWWSLLPYTIAKRWQEQRLQHDGLFDAARYRAAHSADIEACSAPLRHLLLRCSTEWQNGDSSLPR